MNLHKNAEDAKLDLQIAPLIDVVFLLLIYFMVTAALIKKEGDVSFLLPAKGTPQTMSILPVEVVIEIMTDGTVEVEGMRFAADDKNLDDLVLQILGSKSIANSQGADFFVNLLPHKDTLHTRVIDVMDACAAAKVKGLTFSKAQD